MWRDNAHAINVTGDALWYDHKAGKGGVGTIDLVMHLDGQSFREAVNSLSGGHYRRLDAQPSVVVMPLPERRPLADLMDEYARRDDASWPNAFAYLTKRRCLPASVIEDLYKYGRIYANDRGGVVFLHPDELGQLGGATIKSANRYSHFSQCIGNKTSAWFHVGCAPYEAATIAITESPIDAISYHVLHPEKHLCVVSVAGQYIPDDLLRVSHNKKTIIAIDNPALERSEQAADITRGIIETTLAKCPHAHLHTPAAKDWNDDLCQAARKQRIKTQ
jgi:Toprim-like/Protein of unknown function (DUF3991)